MPHAPVLSGLIRPANRMINNRRSPPLLWKQGCRFDLLPKAQRMFRFDQLIRRDMVIRDIKSRYPQTIPVFEQFRFRPACDDCDIETVARKNGINPLDVVEALNQAAFGSKADTENHASD